MLEIENLAAGYGDTAVLFDISLSVRQGEIVSLVGRNGAGKSTTLKSVVGLVRATSGAIRLDGRDITRLPTYRIARSGIGYVPEERSIFPDLTVEENLRVTRNLSSSRSRWTRARIFALFPKLEELRHRAGGWLSGGEQQMLCIARTLMGDPAILLLDEPSEGLAPVVIDGLREQIGELRREGMSILLSEQNMAFARALSDRLYLIDRGEIRFEGTFADLDAQPELRERYLFVAGGAPLHLALTAEERSASACIKA